MGFVVATGCLHGVGIANGGIHRWRFGQKLLRAVGGVIRAGRGFTMGRTVAWFGRGRRERSDPHMRPTSH